ncbi:integrative conjugal element protein [Mycoplasma capricolum subsp. capricolum]|uniref:integrative conjugal element protein n=1 Tax=Mycoplasma capricolum TaxID=2095 RepID=UPI003DA5250F
MVVVKFEFAKEGVKKRPNPETGHIHNHNFYTSGSYLDYITRQKAVYIQEDWKTKQDLKEEWEQQEQSEKGWKNFLISKVKSNWVLDKTEEEIKKKTGLYKLFEKEPIDINVDKEKQIVSKISKEQHIWELIINPGQIGIDNLSVDKNGWNKILNQHLKGLLKANNIDPNKITGHWVIHSNKKYPHVHLSFWEKYPDVNSNYRKKGAFKKETLKEFSQLIENSLVSQDEYEELNEIKASVWMNRKEIRQMFADSFKKIYVTDNIKIIKDFYKNKNNRNYASIKNDSIGYKAVWELFRYVINNNQELKEKYQEYKNTIKEIDSNSYNSLKVEKLKENFLENENAEFDQQLGNLIVKGCLNYDDQKIYLGYGSNKNNLEWLMKKWEFEYEQILFERKMEALKKFNQNIKQKHLLR